ncbi:hypothetical protein EWB00_001520 [Schistosoma japonicum]|uniref:Uncharacterized protein n=1 Tax=Schistosoma japonicum TaxID=6182 RepID=A0A4Z2CK47_SCHJA|nr:hypothetical protein EWB00_001520 [Schistosoma japonicum]
MKAWQLGNDLQHCTEQQTRQQDYSHRNSGLEKEESEIQGHPPSHSKSASRPWVSSLAASPNTSKAHPKRLTHPGFRIPGAGSNRISDPERSLLPGASTHPGSQHPPDLRNTGTETTWTP